MKETKKQHFFVTDYKNYVIANQLYGQPFTWLLSILQSMTGYRYPSGYALLNPKTKTITSIWAGPTEEYPLLRMNSCIEDMDCCIYIDNFDGPERACKGWAGIPSKHTLESTFKIVFEEEKLEYFGGFPNELSLCY